MKHAFSTRVTATMRTKTQTVISTIAIALPTTKKMKTTVRALSVLYCTRQLHAMPIPYVIGDPMKTNSAY